MSYRRVASPTHCVLTPHGGKMYSADRCPRKCRPERQISPPRLTPNSHRQMSCIIGQSQASRESLPRSSQPTTIPDNVCRCNSQGRHAAASTITRESPPTLRFSPLDQLPRCKNSSGQRSLTCRFLKASIDSRIADDGVFYSTANYYGKASNSPRTTSASMPSDGRGMRSESTRMSRISERCRSWFNMV